MYFAQCNIFLCVLLGGKKIFTVTGKVFRRNVYCYKKAQEKCFHCKIL